MKKDCNTCAYSKPTNCEVLTERIKENCYAWADEKEKQAREKAIINYSGVYGSRQVSKNILPESEIRQRQKSRKLNLIKRDGKSVKQILDEHFNWWYLRGFTDTEIAAKLYVTIKAVNNYRRDIKLPPNKKGAHNENK